MTRSRLFWTLFLTVGAWLLVVPAANAYIELFSGSAIFSVIIAGVMSAALTVKVFWRRIRSFFGRESSPAPAEQVESETT